MTSESREARLRGFERLAGNMREHLRHSFLPTGRLSASVVPADIVEAADHIARLEAENARLAGVLRRIEAAGDLGPHDGECAQIARAALAQDDQPVAGKEG